MFNNKIANMVMALIIAIGMWSYVVYAVNPLQKETFKDIPVHIVNEEILNAKGLAIANGTAFEVDITVEGKRKVISAMDQNSFYASADVSECIAGHNNVPIVIKINRNANLVSDETMIARINVEELVFQNKPVKVVLAGDPGTNREVETELLSENSIEISGARSLVAATSYVEAKVDVDQMAKAEQITESQLAPVTRSGKKIENINLEYDTAQVRVAIHDTKAVPLTLSVVGEPAAGCSYVGIRGNEKITIRGDGGILESIETIAAEPIDITGFSANTEVNIVPVLPDGISLSQSEGKLKAVVYIDTDNTLHKTFRGSDVEIRNLEEDLEGRVITGNINVTISGAGELSDDDFELFVNLKGMEEGEHEVALHVKYKGEGSATVYPEKVKVRISRKE